VFDGASFAEIISDHLRSDPVAPSVRMGRSVPSDLEALIMRCLRKSPSERPQSARALREALGGCRMVPRWTSDDAAAWWHTFRADGGPSHPASEPPVTIDVDSGGRLSEMLTR
jgi:hypothetical protein